MELRIDLTSKADRDAAARIFDALEKYETGRPIAAQPAAPVGLPPAAPVGLPPVAAQPAAPVGLPPAAPVGLPPAAPVGLPPVSAPTTTRKKNVKVTPIDPAMAMAVAAAAGGGMGALPPPVPPQAVPCALSAPPTTPAAPVAPVAPAPAAPIDFGAYAQAAQVPPAQAVAPSAPSVPVNPEVIAAIITETSQGLLRLFGVSNEGKSKFLEIRNRYGFNNLGEVPVETLIKIRDEVSVALNGLGVA